MSIYLNSYVPLTIGTSMTPPSPKGIITTYGGDLKGIISSLWSLVKPYGSQALQSVVNNPQAREVVSKLIEKGISSGSEKLGVKVPGKEIANKLSESGRDVLNRLIKKNLGGNLPLAQPLKKPFHIKGKGISFLI